MNNDIYIIRHRNSIRTTSATTSGTASIYDSLLLMLFINTQNILRLPEKGFSGRPILFSFENCKTSVSSLDGNCEATGEALVNSLPGAFESYYKAKAKERQGMRNDLNPDIVQNSAQSDTGRVRDKLAEKAGAFSAYTATLYTTNQLNINTLRRGALKFWEQIKININVKH